MLAIWLDPGLLTGVCAVDAESGDLLYLDEHDLLRTGQLLEPDIQTFHGPEPLIGAWNRHAVSVGWETYCKLQGPQTPAPWSLEVIGAARYLCLKYGYTILDPQAPKVREVCTDRMLRDIGWYGKIKGKKDAKSAAQHTVAWWLKTNTLPERYHDAIYGPLR